MGTATTPPAGNDAVAQPDLADFLARIEPALPARCILARADQTRAYECDGLTLYRQAPPLVLLPEDEAQLIAIVNACRAFAVPIVPRGAGTGLSGGATPHPQGVVVALTRFDRILHLDPEACTAVVQPGVRNLEISEAAAPYGLHYAPDPSSQIACSIGGNVAENAGGVHCLKYGLTVHNVLRVRMVTSEGEVVELGSAAPDAPGLNLLQAFVGSEGLLGLATEVTLRLVPRPQFACVVMASFPSIELAGQGVARIIADGVIPAGLELMDQRSIRMVEPFVNAGYDMQAAAIVLCESDGTPEEVAEEVARVATLLHGVGATRLQTSSSEAERLKFWAGRKNAFPAAGRISPDYYCMDGTVPRRRLAEALAAIVRMEDAFGLRCANVFHAGDGNLHPMILFDGNRPDEVERAKAFGAAILRLCIEVGGSITGEHGVGIEKIDMMCSQFSRAELDAFAAVKRAFDPHGLLNPLKVIPTLSRCAEYGRMHVHRGDIPFPDIPRF
jgi:glycolate oxidase